MTARVRTRLQLLWFQVRTRPVIHVIALLMFVSMISSASSSVAAYRAQRDSETAVRKVDEFVQTQLHEACLVQNQSRHDARELMRRGDIESGEAVIAAVTEAVADPHDPEVQAFITAFRRLLSQRQQAIIDEHAADDQDCDLVAPLPD